MFPEANKIPTLLKVKSDYLEVIKRNCEVKTSENSSLFGGYVGNFTGVPVIIDDTLESDFKFEY